MLIWKKNIFVNAIKTRIVTESKVADVIIADYVALTGTEKAEILASI